MAASNFLHTTALRTIRETILRASILPRTPAVESQLRTAPQTKKSLNIMFFVNKHNGLSQRIAEELAERCHIIDVREITDPIEMTTLANQTRPDLIVCPFLTKRVPDEVIYNPHDIPCMIVHPGIEGDRGMTSIDWALKYEADSWGVTVMQAATEMDTGDIWSTREFPIDRENVDTLTKSSLYSNEVTNAAVENCFQAVENFVNETGPRPLDYSLPHVRGRLRPNMKRADRHLDWEQPAEDVARQVRMSDSSPGAIARVKISTTMKKNEWSENLRAFGAYIEESGFQELKGIPGEVLGQRDAAILVKCGKGAVWLSHLKKEKLKLPATFWLKNLKNAPHLPGPPVEVPHGMFPKTFQEIWTSVTPEGVCHVNFNFYNGAMSTTQCKRLGSVLGEVEKDGRVKVILLKGGYNFFSNGIHLNVIESAHDPVYESWRNINAINDVVQRIFMSKKVTISAVQGNAGAGGAMMALASDLTLSREGVVFNPHYRTMHLFGSEYHTFFLPQKVGNSKAEELLSAAGPMLSTEAVRVGFLDAASGRTHREFGDFTDHVARKVASPSTLKDLRIWKENNRTNQWVEALQKHRIHELAKMAKDFGSVEYHRARKAFVYH